MPANCGHRGHSAGPVPTGLRDSGHRKRRLETDNESSKQESSEESSSESSEESTSRPPAKKPRGNSKSLRKQLQTKPLRKHKPQKKEEDMTACELVAHWNCTARVKKKSETLQGCLKKTQRKRDGQNQLLCRMKPGTKAL